MAFFVFLLSKSIIAKPQDSLEITLKNSTSKAYLYACSIRTDMDINRLFFIYKIETPDTTLKISDYIKIKNRKNIEIAPLFYTVINTDGYGMIYYLFDSFGWANSFEILRNNNEYEKFNYEVLPDTLAQNLKIYNLYNKLQKIITCNILYDRKLGDYTSIYYSELSVNFEYELMKYFPYWEFAFNNELKKGVEKYSYDSSVFFYKKMLETGKRDDFFLTEFFQVYIQKILKEYKDATDSVQYSKVIESYNDLISIFGNYKKSNIIEGIETANFNILLSKYFMSSEKRIEEELSYFESEFVKYRDSKFKFHSYLILGNIYSIVGRNEEAKTNYNIIIYSAKDGNIDAKKYLEDAQENLDLISK